MRLGRLEKSFTNSTLRRFFRAVEAQTVGAGMAHALALVAAHAERAHHKLTLRRYLQTRPQTLACQKTTLNQKGKNVRLKRNAPVKSVCQICSLLKQMSVACIFELRSNRFPEVALSGGRPCIPLKVEQVFSGWAVHIYCLFSWLDLVQHETVKANFQTLASEHCIDQRIEMLRVVFA